MRSEIGIVDDPGETKRCRRFDLVHDLYSGFRIRSERTVAVDHKEHIVIVLFRDPSGDPSKGNSALIIAADVHHAGQTPVINQRVHLLRKRRNIQVGIHIGRSDQLHACLRKLLHAVCTAEIRIDDVKVRNDHMVMVPAQIQRHVDCQVRLSAPVVSAKKRDPFIIHV